MVSSTGTFVSCKDYDDDIDRIDNTLNDLKTRLDALQTKVDGGKYVTNVTKDGEGIIITWNDNSTNKIETIKGDKGDKGDAVEITIDPTTKNWKIDGVDTGICAEGKNGTSSNGVSAKSPSIDKTSGNWIVYEWNEEKQDYVGTDTGISAKGASAYVVDEGNYYTLNVAADKAGSSLATVKLPKAPVVITEVEVLGTLGTVENGLDYVNEGKEIKYNYTFVTDEIAKKAADWNAEAGVKKLTEGQVLSTLDNINLMVRVAPALLDASKFSFTLVNSKLVEAPFSLAAPVAYEGLLGGEASKTTTRAASGNGLWTIASSAKEGLTYEKADDYDAQFKKGSQNILFALQEKDGFATLYNLAFVKSTTTMTDAKVEKVNGVAVTGSKTDGEYKKTDLQSSTTGVNAISLGDVKITFDKPVYDAHLHIDNATIQRWGITNISGTSFTVNKRPDDVTAANFQVQVHYVSMTGKVESEWIPFKVGKSYANVVTLASKNIEISATNDDNTFENSLDPMYTALGDNVELWKEDTDKTNFIYEYCNANGEWEKADDKNNAGNIKAELDGKTSKVIVSMKSNATKMDLTKSYRVKIEFKDGEEVLNTVYQPVTFSIPAMSKIFVQQPGVFVDGVAYAYMDAKADADKKLDATYNLKGAFVDLAGKLGSSTFTAELDNETKVVGDYKSQGLAELKVLPVATDNEESTAADEATVIDKGNVANWVIALKDNLDDKPETNELNSNGTQKGYGKELIVNLAVKYLNVYEYEDDYTFKVVVLSPILEGEVKAVNGEVLIPATDLNGTKVTDANIKGYTYNDIVYSIFYKDATDTWARKEIKAVETSVPVESENLFTASQLVKKAGTTASHILVTPKNLKETTSGNMTIKVTDAWGYKLTQNIKVTVKVGE